MSSDSDDFDYHMQDYHGNDDDDNLDEIDYGDYDSDDQHLHDEEDTIDAEENGEQHLDIDEENTRQPMSLHDLLGTFSRNNMTTSGLPDSIPDLLSMFANSHSTGTTRLQFSRNQPNNRYSKLIDNVLNAKDDSFMAMESLKELSESLLMTNQILIDRLFSIDKLTKGIIQILSDQPLSTELELQLIATRCLYNLFEVDPDSILTCCRKDISAILLRKLEYIDFIDLAEQIYELLELISRFNPLDLIKSSTIPMLKFCLQYLDFFTIHTQKKSISILANCFAAWNNNKSSRISLIESEIDNDTLSELFQLLKNVLFQNSDQFIMNKIIISFYCIASLKKDENILLETLFDTDVIKKFIQLIISNDIKLETKLKCLTILSVLTETNSEMSISLINSVDIINNFLIKCVNTFLNTSDKESNPNLHEALMFVPKSLLRNITRFLMILLPSENFENDRIESATLFKKNFKEPIDNTNTLKFYQELTPFLVEIYVNTVDYDIRKFILASLTRVVSGIDANNTIIMKSLKGHFIHIICSSLAQLKSNLTNKNENKNLYSMNIKNLLLVLSLLNLLLEKFPGEFFVTFKREGAFDLILYISDILSLSEDKNKLISTNATSNLLDQDDEQVNEDEESDSDHNRIRPISTFGDLDIPDHIEPNIIVFDLFTKFSNKKVLSIVSSSISALLEIYEKSDSTDSLSYEGLSKVKDTVEILSKIDLTSEHSYEFWNEVWIDLKNSMFNENFTISSFELISTGLVDSLSRIAQNYNEGESIVKKSFLFCFNDTLVKLVGLLQSALIRVEDFDIVLCGLPNSEIGVLSLGKQMKIRLEYSGNADEDKIKPNLRSFVISVHCISSIKALSDFLKHQLIFSNFLATINPNSFFNSSENDASHDDEQLSSDLEYPFEFKINDEKINWNDTVFGACYKHFKNKDRKISTLWNEIPIIQFTKIKSIEQTSLNENNNWNNIYSINNISRKLTTPADPILKVLKFSLTEGLSNDSVINSKLSAKLSRQMEEPLAIASGILPDWTLYLTTNYPFLFPFKTRIEVLEYTSFGYGRLIQKWMSKNISINEASNDEQLQKLGKLARHKLRLSRSTLFLSALKILDKYGSFPSILEMEYQGEVGTGVGPTLEFYASVSREFAKKSLNMWREDDINSEENTKVEEEYILQYLFPKPINESSENMNKVIELFNYLGTFVARSMLDNRILDFRFNKAFFELCHLHCRQMKESHCLDLEGQMNLLKQVDKHVYNSLKYLKENSNDDLLLKNLTISFVLPGTDYELIPNGSNILVGSSNVHDYVSSVLNQFVGQGVTSQIKSFITGFSEVFQYSSLLMLTPNELVSMFGCFEEDWRSETLYSYMKAEHGYRMDSSTIHDLISIMQDLDGKQRRKFTQFITGSPKLPLGGFKSLNPHLTVVLKHAEDGLTPDQCLPSVMTCSNYLKLPKYSNIEVMRSRILQAIDEGSGVFLLS